MERKKPEDQRRSWAPSWPVRVYLDDVQEMIATLERLNPKTVTVETDVFRGLNTVEDLRDLVEEPKTVTLSAFLDEQEAPTESWAQPTPAFSVHFEIEPEKSWIEKGLLVQAESDDLKLAGALNEIQATVNRCRRISVPSWLVGYSVMVGMLGFFFALLSDEHSVERSVGFVVELLGLFVGGSAWLIRVTRPPIAFVRAWRADKPTFFQRNRDQVVLAVASAVLGALLGFGLAVLFQQ